MRVCKYECRSEGLRVWIQVFIGSNVSLQNKNYFSCFFRQVKESAKQAYMGGGRHLFFTPSFNRCVSCSMISWCFAMSLPAY